MKNIYKNKSFYNRILDKVERRNRGSLLLLLKNFFFYLKAKIKKTSLDKRAYILEQLNKNSTVVEVGVWKGDFSKQIWNISSPNLLVLVDSWKFDKKVRGCAPQVSGEEPLNQNFFDQAKKDTYDKFENIQNVNILDFNSLEASSKYEDNFFDYSYSIGSLEHFTEEQIIEFLKSARRVTKYFSFHQIPMSKSDKDEGWISPLQSYFNNSKKWWLDKCNKVYDDVQILDSSWEDKRSIGRWLILRK